MAFSVVLLTLRVVGVLEPLLCVLTEVGRTCDGVTERLDCGKFLIRPEECDKRSCCYDESSEPHCFKSKEKLGKHDY